METVDIFIPIFQRQVCELMNKWINRNISIHNRLNKINDEYPVSPDKTDILNNLECNRFIHDIKDSFNQLSKDIFKCDKIMRLTSFPCWGNSFKIKPITNYEKFSLLCKFLSALNNHSYRDAVTKLCVMRHYAPRAIKYVMKRMKF